MKWALAHNGTLNNMTSSNETNSTNSTLRVLDNSEEARAFRRCDTNNDSIISIDEAKAFFAKQNFTMAEMEAAGRIMYKVANESVIDLQGWIRGYNMFEAWKRREQRHKERLSHNSSNMTNVTIKHETRVHTQVHMKNYSIVYLGCYKDKGGDRVLPTYVSTAKDKKSCAQAASKRGAKYFGL